MPQHSGANSKAASRLTDLSYGDPGYVERLLCEATGYVIALIVRRPVDAVSMSCQLAAKDQGHSNQQ